MAEQGWEVATYGVSSGRQPIYILAKLSIHALCILIRVPTSTHPPSIFTLILFTYIYIVFLLSRYLCIHITLFSYVYLMIYFDSFSYLIHIRDNFAFLRFRV